MPPRLPLRRWQGRCKALWRICRSMRKVPKRERRRHIADAHKKRQLLRFKRRQTGADAERENTVEGRIQKAEVDHFAADKAQTAALCRRAARDAENIAGEEYKKVDVKAPQKPFDADEKGGGGDACCAHAAEHMAEQHQKARIPLRRSASRSRFTVYPSFLSILA